MTSFNLRKKFNYFNEFPWLWGCLHYIEGYEDISKKVITAEHLTILKVPKAPSKLWLYLKGYEVSGTGDCALYAPLCIKECHAEKNVLGLFNLDIPEIFDLGEMSYNNAYFRKLKPHMVAAMCIAISPDRKSRVPYEWSEAKILLPPYRFLRRRNFSKICSSIGVE